MTQLHMSSENISPGMKQGEAATKILIEQKETDSDDVASCQGAGTSTVENIQIHIPTGCLTVSVPTLIAYNSVIC